MSRADKITLERKKTELYSDFLTNFDQNPITGTLARVTNEESVKQSLRNLVLTNTGERFYDNNKGSKIRQSLFESYDPDNLEIIKIQLKETIDAYEPRANILDINFTDGLDENSYGVSIIFSIINIPNSSYDISINISRVR